jgi:hypothetical protein
MVDLKPCPFCGGAAIQPKNDHARMWVIRCEGCNVEVWEKNDGHFEQDFLPMIAFAWNRRAPIEDEPDTEPEPTPEERKRRYMGQVMAECDCSREGACEEAGRCLATGPDFLEEMQQ